MAKQPPLVCQYLENISRDALRKYQDIIRDYIRDRQGVYALYRRGKLYYVGLAGNLRGRLTQHLKDHHQDSWDRFSVYLTVGDSHLRELESLLLRIVRPAGNKQSGKFSRKCQNLKQRFSRDVRRQQNVELADVLGVSRKRLKDVPQVHDGKRSPLEGVIRLPAKLRGKYKNKVYWAHVRKDGCIRWNGHVYATPSHAARAVSHHSANGWWFWHYERAPGDWVRLKALRRNGKKR